MRFSTICFSAIVGLATASSPSEFIDTIGPVYGNDLNKTAYAYWSSQYNASQFILDETITIDPSVVPDEAKSAELVAWMDKSAFDTSIDYYSFFTHVLEGQKYPETKQLESLLETCGVPAQQLSRAAISRATGCIRFPCSNNAYCYNLVMNRNCQCKSGRCSPS